ncbi:hypothetical protein [Desulfovibrio sp. X2]|uniref:hypothetical protein n=1 Tax=Desulfovibrio sp. X2 TaxID=941449 RepID=UPI0012681A28|nr:hypothetical protein [Desulfovibrio sp. X2]
MKIFESTQNIQDAVDSVLKHGFAAIDGTKSTAVPYAERVVNALVPHNISASIGYQNTLKNGYLYYVVDLERYPCGDEELKRLIDDVDSDNDPCENF